MAAFWAIVRLTALETVRRPVFLLVTLCGLAGTTLMPFFLNYTLGDAPRIIRDSSLALLFTGGLLLAAWSAAEALGGELRRGTASVALAKPVSRTAFLLAKALGVAVALGGHGAASLAATLLAVRAGTAEWHLDWTAEGPALAVFPVALGLAAWRNRRTGRPFASAACLWLWAGFAAALVSAACRETPLEQLAFPKNLDWEIVPAGALACLPALMASAMATALSTRLGTVPVLMACAALFTAGLMADSLLGPHLETSFWARSAYALLPDGQAFWLSDALDAGRGLPAVYGAGACLHALLWAGGWLAAGAWAFRKSEVS